MVGRSGSSTFPDAYVNGVAYHGVPDLHSSEKVHYYIPKNITFESLSWFVSGRISSIGFVGDEPDCSSVTDMSDMYSATTLLDGAWIPARIGQSCMHFDRMLEGVSWGDYSGFTIEEWDMNPDATTYKMFNSMKVTRISHIFVPYCTEYTITRLISQLEIDTPYNWYYDKKTRYIVKGDLR